MPTGDPVLRLTACITKLQEQMEKLANMQTESTMTINKLSNVVLHLSQEVNNVKSQLVDLESREKREMDTEPHAPLLSDVVAPVKLTCDPVDIFGPLVPRRARVLVVEDDSAYQWLVSKHLEAKGIDCILAPTANDALLSIRTGEFDLILMDIQLPGGISGLDAAQRIRAFDMATPIVSMTSATSPRQIATYLAGGMNDVLPKPFSREGLLSLVSRFCSATIAPAEEIASSFESELSFGSTTNQKTTYTFGLI